MIYPHLFWCCELGSVLKKVACKMIPVHLRSSIISEWEDSFASGGHEIMDSMVSDVPTETKDDELESQKAQEVIGLLLRKSDNSETVLQGDFSVSKAIQDLSGSTVTVSIAGPSPLNICHVSLTDSGMILEPSEIIQQSLTNSPSIQLEDGTTAFVQNFEPVEESDSGDATTKFVDGQAVQLEDGTTAFIHAAPREGLQPVQLEDGTMAYLSQTGTELFNGEATGLDLEQLTSNPQVIDVAMKDLDMKVNDNICRMATNRSVEKAFRCEYPECQRLYTTLHHLKVHERSHTGDRPFKCAINGCTKAFATGYGLKSHTRVHTGETPYKCPEETCMKAFKTSGDLQKHVRTHTGERPFKCPYNGCDRAFTTSNIRKVHLRTHTGERPYICTLEGCGRAFASATNYKNHIRIHTGEKPYICSVPGCSKRFTEYSSLYKHHVVHTHSKPYICSFCGKTYRQTSTLAMHKRTAHGVLELNESEVTSTPEDTQSNSDKKDSGLSEVETAVGSVDLKTDQKPKTLTKQPDAVETTLPVTKSFPTIVTLQGSSSNPLLQEHPVYAVQLQEDGTLSSTMQQIVLVADTAQLAALQQLAQQGQFEAVLPATDTNSLQDSPVEANLFPSKQCIQVVKPKWLQTKQEDEHPKM